MRDNLEQIPNLVAFCSHVGLVNSIIPIHLRPQNAHAYILRSDGKRGGGCPALGFERRDEPRLREVFGSLLDMKKHGHLIHNSSWFLEKAPDFLLGRPIVWTCDSPDLYFSVSSSGTLLPCVDRDSDVYILEDDFPEQFRSGRIRDRLRSNVHSCEGCFYACYPEFSKLVRSPRIMIERALQIR